YEVVDTCRQRVTRLPVLDRERTSWDSEATKRGELSPRRRRIDSKRLSPAMAPGPQGSSMSQSASDHSSLFRSVQTISSVYPCGRSMTVMARPFLVRCDVRPVGGPSPGRC